MNTLLEKIIELSHEYGNRILWVIGGGGNASIKDENWLWIKASGFNLGTISAEGFVRMDLQKVKSLLQKQYPENVEERERAAKMNLLTARAPGEEDKRPSVETGMHALFPQSIVFHTHPTLVNGLACSREGKEATKKLFGDGVLWVPVMNPGIVLAQYMEKEIGTYTRARNGRFPRAVFLQNHGLVAYGETPEEIHLCHTFIAQTLKSVLPKSLRDRYEQWEQEEDSKLSAFSATGSEVGAVLHEFAREELGKEATVLEDDTPLFGPFLQNEEGFTNINGAFSPDHIVYAGHRPVWVESVASLKKTIAEYKQREGTIPRVIVVKNTGVFALGATKNKANLCLLLARDMAKIALLTECWGGPLFMPKEQVQFIRNWEVEQFRQRLA